jgi:hypothetical protein
MSDAGRRVRTVRFRTLVIAVWLVVGLLRLSVYTWRAYGGPAPVGHWAVTPTTPFEGH